MSDESLSDYIEEMRQRYPGLSKRKMCILAGVPDNLIYKISEGLTPRPATLQKLAFNGAQETYRTDDEKWEDYAELLKRAGYEVPESPHITEEEWEWIKRWRNLTPEQRALANAFFRAYSAGDAMEILMERTTSSSASSADEAFTRFLELLGEMTALSPEERTALLADVLGRYRKINTQGDSQAGHAE